MPWHRARSSSPSSAIQGNRVSARGSAARAAKQGSTRRSPRFKATRATENGNGAPREAHSDLGGTRWLSVISVWNLASSAASHSDTGPFTELPCPRSEGRRLPRAVKSATACMVDKALADTLTAWRRHLHAHPELTLHEKADRRIRLREAARTRRVLRRRRRRPRRCRDDRARRVQSQRRAACRHGRAADHRDDRPRRMLRPTRA